MLLNLSRQKVITSDRLLPRKISGKVLVFILDRRWFRIIITRPVIVIDFKNKPNGTGIVHLFCSFVRFLIGECRRKSVYCVSVPNPV